MQGRFGRWMVVHAVVAAGMLPAALAQSEGMPAKMAPLSEYLIADRASEIALARSAAPASIGSNAEVLVLGSHGYETEAKGTNGFVCIVERAWTKETTDADFWDPKISAPMCLNAAAARSYLPTTILKTKLALEGKSKEEIAAGVNAAFDEKKLPPIEPGSMCYMLSKQGDLGGTTGPWHPHVMVFFSSMEQPESWGANAPGSPLIGNTVKQDRYTVFIFPARQWSDGTPDANPMMHH